MSKLLTGLHKIYLSTLKRDWRRFQTALRDPAVAQMQIWQKFIANQSETVWGKTFHLREIKTLAEFQKRIPIQSYERLEPWVDQVKAGLNNGLSTDPVLAFEKTGGSTATNKFIPLTKSYLNEISHSTNAWLYELHRSYPKLIGKQSYWSLSPVGRDKQYTSAGIPIGLESDAEYFGPIARFFLNQFFAVPQSVAQIRDMEAWRKATCQHLMSCETLGLISVWSPSFLILLMQDIEQNLAAYLKLLPVQRRKQIERARGESPTILGEHIWPNLQVISTWADGISEEMIPQLQHYFPNTSLQAKGLLATEGVISIPWSGETGSVLAVTSHFLEFSDITSPDGPTLLAHELQIGKRYSPIITTANGFCRYHLKDIIECVGYEQKTPRIRFICKLDRVSDMCGEKISSAQVENALAMVREKLHLQTQFFLLAPVRTNGLAPFYTAFVDSHESDARLLQALQIMDDYLLTGHHYRYCRDLGQLAPMQIVRVKNGVEIYQQTLTALGQRLGDIKLTHFDHRTHWWEAFQNKTVIATPTLETVQHVSI